MALKSLLLYWFHYNSKMRTLRKKKNPQSFPWPSYLNISIKLPCDSIFSTVLKSSHVPPLKKKKRILTSENFKFPVVFDLYFFVWFHDNLCILRSFKTDMTFSVSLQHVNISNISQHCQSILSKHVREHRP